MNWRSFFIAMLVTNPLLSALADSLIATIPIKLQHNRILLSGKLNATGPHTFLLDSACTIPTIHPSLIDELKLEPSGRVRINGIAGVERAPTYRNLTLQFGEASYKPRRVASLPSEREHSRRRDGVIGSGFFETFVVELRPREKVIKLHKPGSFEYSGKGEIIPLRFREEIPVVDAAMTLKDGSVLKGEFEVDTGCDSGICLGDHFVKEHSLVSKLSGKESEKFGIGGSVDTVDVRIPTFSIGAREFKNAQSDLFLDGSPVDKPLAGHIGMGTLGKGVVILDYSRKRMIVE
ncbi:MAG TPA: aspartyl protease family protein [Verrucomicrobiae bacterium]